MADKAKENVQVIVRCRPINSKESEEGQNAVVRVDDTTRQIDVTSKSNKPLKSFQFDSVFGPNANQRDIYNATITPIVDEVLKGYNCTIFAYGQTGTGKTYTMEGRRESFGESSNPAHSAAQRWKNSRDDGIIARSVNQIFETLEKGGNEFSVRVSHLELYNEELRDLLNTTNKGLKLYEDASSGGKVVVHSLEEKMVYTPQDIFDILQRSWEERRTAETEMNKNSSRSHCIFSITIHMKEASPEGEDLIKIGKLNLVDLAGSENIGRSGADKVQSRKQEACMINKSLLTLGRVITALTEGQPHVPYRESKLTRLLQDSLGGTTKTCIIATISPASGSIEETLSTLDYAHRAKNIKNRPECNAKMSKREVLREFSMEITTLKAQLDAMRRQQGVYLPLDQFQQMETNTKEHLEKIQALEALIEQKEKDFAELQEMLDLQGKQLDRTQVKLTETSETLAKTADQLRVTSDTLAITKESLDEHKYLLHEHEDTESKFHEEANVVLGTLDVTLNDISGLFSKIERKDNLELANNESWLRFRDSLLGRVRAVEGKVASFIITERSRYAKLHEKIEGFIDQKDRELKSTLSRIDDFEKAATEHFDLQSSRTKSFCKDAVGRVDATMSADSDYERNFETKIDKFIKDSKMDLERLQESLVVRQKELSEWAKLRHEKMGSALDRTERFLHMQGSQLESAKSVAKHASEWQVSRLESHKASLDAFIASQKQENQKVQQDLMGRIQQLVETYFEQHHMAAAGAVRSINMSLEESMTQSKARASEIVSSMDTALLHTASLMEEVKSTDTDSRAQLEELIAREAVGKTAMSDVIDKFESGVVDFADSALSCTRTRTASRFAELKHSKSELAAYLAHQSELADQASKDTSRRLEDDIRAAIRQHQDSSGEFFEKISSDFETSKAGVSDFQIEFSSSSEVVIENLATFSLHSYQATGATPQKRDFAFPRNLSRTKPRDVLLQEWRKLREAGMDLDIVLKSEIGSEATSTSTLVIDDDSSSDISSSEEPKEPLSAEVQIAPPAPAAAAPAPVQRAPSATKLSASMKPASAKQSAPVAQGKVASRAPAPNAKKSTAAVPVSKTLSRQISKGQQLKEIVNQANK